MEPSCINVSHMTAKTDRWNPERVQFAVAQLVLEVARPRGTIPECEQQAKDIRTQLESIFPADTTDEPTRRKREAMSIVSGCADLRSQIDARRPFEEWLARSVPISSLDMTLVEVEAKADVAVSGSDRNDPENPLAVAYVDGMILHYQGTITPLLSLLYGGQIEPDRVLPSVHSCINALKTITADRDRWMRIRSTDFNTLDTQSMAMADLARHARIFSNKLHALVHMLSDAAELRERLDKPALHLRQFSESPEMKAMLTTCAVIATITEERSARLQLCLNEALEREGNAPSESR